MSAQSRFVEDIPQLAAEAYQLAVRHCGSCQDYHATWPYLRLSRGVVGVEMVRRTLEATLRDLIAGGRRHILIAGSADTGVTALVARAADGYPADITMLDRCRTPVELCRHFAERWSLPMKAMQKDLLTLENDNVYDIVFMHSVLQFVAEDRRVHVLERIRRALRASGRLLIAFRTGVADGDEAVFERHRAYADEVVAWLEEQGVALPEGSEVFRRRLMNMGQLFAAHDVAFAGPEQIDRLLDAAGFVVEQRTLLDPSGAAPARSGRGRVKHRYVTVARPA